MVWFVSIVVKNVKNKNSLIQHEIRCKQNPNQLSSPLSTYNRTHEVWNKGLSKETDVRVKRAADALHRKYLDGELIAPQKGKPHTIEEKLKISKSMKKFLSVNPDMIPYKRNHSSKQSYPETYFIDVFRDHSDIIYHKRAGLYELDFCCEETKRYFEIDRDQHILDQRIVKHDLERNSQLIQLGWTGYRLLWSDYKNMSDNDKQLECQKLLSF